MNESMMHWLGAAVALSGGMILAAVLCLLAGWLLLQSAAYMLRNGLHIIRLSNWRYWNNRMYREGLICMQDFYREQVRIHKPKGLADFHELDQAADAAERKSRVAD